MIAMVRRCSRCGKDGHNSRTCKNHRREVVRLFGVQLNPLLENSRSDHLPYCTKRTECRHGFPGDCRRFPDGSVRCCIRTSERKKGVPWTEEEHRKFLAGLEKLGRGSWRGISRSYVTTRTPTQVASHAQKHFLKQNRLNKQKRHVNVLQSVESSNEFLNEGSSISEETSATGSNQVGNGAFFHFKNSISPPSSDHVMSKVSSREKHFPYCRMEQINLELSISVPLVGGTDFSNSSVAENHDQEQVILQGFSI